MVFSSRRVLPSPLSLALARVNKTSVEIALVLHSSTCRSGGPRSMAALNKKDASGDTVKTVAKKHKHADVEAEVLQHLQRLVSCERWSVY